LREPSWAIGGGRRLAAQEGRYSGKSKASHITSIKGNKIPLYCKAVGDLGLQQVCRRSYAGVFICGEDLGQMRVAVST
jgi:hypothetical protein